MYFFTPFGRSAWQHPSPSAPEHELFLSAFMSHVDEQPIMYCIHDGLNTNQLAAEFGEVIIDFTYDEYFLSIVYSVFFQKNKTAEFGHVYIERAEER